MQIPEKVNFILEKLEENGYEGYAVGGCVRDRVLGREPGDWDITTSAKPDEVKAIFHKTIDTGIAHGTVTVRVGGENFEVTTYRVDGDYADHRHPNEVKFTPDLAEDLRRRDFTINAMAFNPRTGIVDLFEGMEDIEKKRVRCVGNPMERLEEDALRMLRGIRFAGQLGFEIHEETLDAIEKLAGTIVNVSAERIRVELTKMLLAKEPNRLLLVEKTGLCQYIFPEFSQMLQTKQNNPHHCYSVGEHAIHAVMEIQKLYQGMEEDTSIYSPFRRDFREEKVKVILVYATLLHDIAKPVSRITDEEGIDHFYGHDQRGAKIAKKVLQRLKFDNDTIQMVTRILPFHEYRYEDNKKAMRRLMNKAGTDLMPYLFLVQQADVMAQSTYKREEKLAKIDIGKRLYAEILEANEAVCIKDLAVSGRDIMDLGISAGPMIGKTLNHLIESVLENPDMNDREKLLNEAQQFICKGLGE